MPEFIPQHLPADAEPPLNAFARAYLTAAEWTLPECDDETKLDASDALGWAPEAVEAARAECAEFEAANSALLAGAFQMPGYGLAAAGHDFWLTRNHHGAGFWDRGLGVTGAELTDAAHACGSVDAYVGDDLLIYFS